MNTDLRFKARRAVLAGVCTGPEHDFQVGMDELAALAMTCGIEPARTVCQHLPWEDRATCMGPGKVEELRSLADAEEADAVIFNNSLSPAQIANLTRLLDVEVLDRTALILEIFASHASTREARIQVEYARLQYMLPRLVGMRRNLSRQGGGSGALSNKGSGEMQIELDRRHIERRMFQLRKELKKISGIRETQRRKRMRNHLPMVSLVGYTNAGKSTLMNSLIDYCEEDSSPETVSGKQNPLHGSSDCMDAEYYENDRHVYAEDMVFATLDTSVRRIDVKGMQPFLLSDTVGFINDLPTFLVEAFHSTLEEVLHSELILNVVDASDPEHDMHMDVTLKTLKELGAGSIPIITVMNKADLVNDHEIGASSVDRIFLCAKDESGMPELIRLIDEKLNGETVAATVLIPYDEMAVSDPIRRQAKVISQEYTSDGLRMQVRMDMELLRRYREYIAEV